MWESKGVYREGAVDGAGGAEAMVTPDRLSGVESPRFPVSSARRRGHQHGVAEPTAVPLPAPGRKEAG